MQLYKISFTTTPKVYIGITSKTAKIRFRDHKRKKSETLISKAIRKHGLENTILTVLCECYDYELLCLAEQEAIEKYNSKNPNGYNLTDGGEGTLGFINSEEQRANIKERSINQHKNNPQIGIEHSIRMKERFISNPDLAKIHSNKLKEFHINNPEFAKQIGKKVSDHYKKCPEARIIISNKQKIRFEDIEQRIHMSEKTKKRFEDPKEKQKQSAAQKKRFESPESRLELSLRQKELFSTKEMKEVISKAQKKRFSDPIKLINSRLSIAVGFAKKAGREFSLLPKDYFNDK